MSPYPSLLPVIDLPAPTRVQDVDERAARLLKLLAEPTRRRIFLALLRGETCNCELANTFALPQNLISHHVRQLREAGFVRERRDAIDARWIYYTVDAEAFQRAWASLAATFDPSLIGTRSPTCGPRA